MDKPMKIIVRAFWDEEAKVWVAVADGDLGLVTQAKTIEELSRKLPAMAEDLLEGDHAGPIDIELLTTSALAAAE
jgi:predicted RNase H-like HicB family nuclease